MSGKRIFLSVLLIYAFVAKINAQQNLLWIDNQPAKEKDIYIAFRGAFNLSQSQEVTIDLCGASWYVVWINGLYFTEGPARYNVKRPEYTSSSISLSAGKNIIAVELHYEGVETRLLKEMQPYLYCKLSAGANEITTEWHCIKLPGYTSMAGRINPQLAWVEWCDTRQIPADWKSIEFNDAGWNKAVPIKRDGITSITAVDIAAVQQLSIQPKKIAEGKLVERYGYELDNISARFFLRDLDNTSLPAQGEWRRYDLGRVRLGRPKFVLDLPAGAVVEFAYSEYLQHNRVMPWINLSAGDSHNMDHYIARGGIQEFFPLTPKGGRYLEVHILAKDSIRFVKEEYMERSYFDKLSGNFSSSDTLLNKIWLTGIETLKACAEDAIIDNATRERGQWVGDLSVSLATANAGFNDLRLIKRGLIQSALSARADGMVAGLCPGGEAYLSSFAMHWISATVNYYRLTGDKKLLQELYPYALKNLQAFDQYRTAAGISKKAGWAFIDWGYVEDQGNTDLALNMHYALGLRDIIQWSTILQKKADAIWYSNISDTMMTLIAQKLNGNKNGGSYAWANIGYHKAILGLALGMFEGDEKKEAITFVKQHILHCFPNDPSAPRLSDPQSNNPRIITPYFSYYAFPILIENGEVDFVLDQYRKCWGWALEDNRTTWVEVFDTRWSQSHQWSGSPTWQLSKYILGLTPAFDQKMNLFKLSFVPNSLPSAKGRIPITATSDYIDVEWHTQGKEIIYTVQPSVPIWIQQSKALTGKDE